MAASLVILLMCVQVASSLIQCGQPTSNKTDPYGQIGRFFGLTTQFLIDGIHQGNCTLTIVGPNTVIGFNHCSQVEKGARVTFGLTPNGHSTHNTVVLEIVETALSADWSVGLHRLSHRLSYNDNVAALCLPTPEKYFPPINYTLEGYAQLFQRNIDGSWSGKGLVTLVAYERNTKLEVTTFFEEICSGSMEGVIVQYENDMSSLYAKIYSSRMECVGSDIFIVESIDLRDIFDWIFTPRTGFWFF